VTVAVLGNSRRHQEELFCSLEGHDSVLSRVAAPSVALPKARLTFLITSAFVPR